MSETKIVILGAGYAGMIAARRLEKKIGGKKEVKILLIDKNPFQTLLTNLHEIAASRIEPEGAQIPLNRVFSKNGKVEVVTDSIMDIDIPGKRLLGRTKSYEYDYLIMSTGCRPTFYNIPGASEHTFQLWSYEAGVKLRRQVESMFEAAALEDDEQLRREYLRFFIAGAGFTGCELAGELAEWFPSLCRKNGIGRDEPELYITDMVERAVPVLPVKCSEKVERKMRALGIRIMLNSKVVSIDEKGITISGPEKQTRYPSRTIIWTAGVEGSALIESLDGKISTGGRFRIETDQYLMSLDANGVFAAGDNLFHIPAPGGRPSLQMVENAEQSGKLCADNIIRLISGHQSELKKYRPVSHGVMVSIGSRYCVSSVSFTGNEKRSISPPAFLSMAAKHLMNMVYFKSAAGFWKVFEYIKDEFISVRDGRSFLALRGPMRKG